MYIHRANLLNAIHTGFFGKSILVVGDLMLDRYLWGEVTRISPEAPVPIVRLQQETEKGGGAAHVALNLANLGIRTTIVGWIGQDHAGQKLCDILQQSGVSTAGIYQQDKRLTITKTRIIGGHQQMLRMDQEDPRPMDQPILINCLENALAQLNQDPKPDAILLSDYGKGLLTETFCQTLITTASKNNIPVYVDPKGSNYHRYRGATALTPNRRELAEATAQSGNQLDDLLKAGEQLRSQLEIDLFAVTLSEQGIVLLQADHEPHFISAVAREVYDVSGAGDTVIATLAASRAAGLVCHDALQLANLAAGIVVAKVGTTPITRSELLSALLEQEALQQSNKICTLEAAIATVTEWRQRGDLLVFTNGCFDLLHAGHVTYLEKARRLGKRLIVGLNNDHSVKTLKGPSRPIIQEADRARVLAAMAAVDLVILFNEETPINLICTLQPDILAKGADYSEEQVVGGVEVKSWGGRVALVPLVEGYSSSRIMAHIKRQ